MALLHAEKLIQAARLAYEGTSFEISDLLCREATRLARKSISGVVNTPELMRKVDAITVESCQLQADLATIKRAGFHVVRGDT